MEYYCCLCGMVSQKAAPDEAKPEQSTAYLDKRDNNFQEFIHTYKFLVLCLQVVKLVMFYVLRYELRHRNRQAFITMIYRLENSVT